MDNPDFIHTAGEDEARRAVSQATTNRLKPQTQVRVCKSRQYVELYSNSTDQCSFVWRFDICLVTNKTGSRCGPALQDDDKRSLRWDCRHQQFTPQRAGSRFQGQKALVGRSAGEAEYKRRDGQVSDASPLPFAHSGIDQIHWVLLRASSACKG